ncbi:hypothetical protein CathTA2_0668 [Caldalkalibacillus thermarum TA2.A1]|uniref:Ribbon-helix-helix protein, CopG family n=1 Tax=Caldalkalibacillus thermarum (strain TA2.A1) TaxID=986075 RepID=F5L4F6_CALTT|nr:ribbon-helix-helix protein, CopG family [Caldalkalibacillus thermarum]EGL83767.1 hypothetical protein CathTA2_0668 [Caldalkalibacillus thermarum TA2.A1]QZT33719.1 ribbon-helix-helix protein, CopG family [Caldalkalibacillus thermarum TA2.A1]
MSLKITFRLTDEDAELVSLFKNVRSSGRSEMIRQMLKFAYRKAVEEDKINKQLERLEQVLSDINGRLLDVEKKLSEGVVVSQVQSQQEQEMKRQTSVRESAEALLQSFGMDLD